MSAEFSEPRDILHVRRLRNAYALSSAIISLADKIAKCKVGIPGIQIMIVNNQNARI